MYSRKNLKWLYLYYSGEKLKTIGNQIFLSDGGVKSRIAKMKLPTRPKGTFRGIAKERWLKLPHIIALRKLFEKE